MASRAIALVLGLLVSACATIPLARIDPTLPARFGTRPVNIVASRDMAPDCAASLYAAAAYFVGLGASLTVSWVDDAHPSIAVEPMPGQVTVHAGKVTTPDALAETEQWYTVGGNIDRAEITLGYCDPWILGHELGHAFGLEHSADRDALMYYSTLRSGWYLSPGERAVIRD